MFDPSTARFLSKDPIGEAGGSPNLYVYCANDPVNQSDPSGNRLWYPIDRCGCKETNVLGESLNPFDVLKRELFYSFGGNHFWPNFHNTRWVELSTEQRKGYVYSEIDPLLGGMPPQAWIEMAEGRGKLSISAAVTQLIKESHTTDFWLCADRFRHPDPGLGEGLISRRTSRRIGLTWSRTPPSGATFAYRVNRTFERYDEAKRRIARIANSLIDAALASLLSTLGIDPEAFFSSIRTFAADIAEAVPAIVSNHEGFFSRLLGGIKEGVEQFSGVTEPKQGEVNGPIRAMLDWLIGRVFDAPVPSADAQALPKSFDFTEITFFLLNLLGFSKHDFRNAAKQDGGDWQELNGAVEALTGIKGGLDPILTNVKDISKLFEKFFQEPDNQETAELPNPFGKDDSSIGYKLFKGEFDALQTTLIDTLFKAGLTALATLLVPGGGIKALINFATQLNKVGPEVIAKVTDLLQNVGQGIKAAAKGQQEDVKRVVVAALGGSIGLLLTLLLALEKNLNGFLNKLKDRLKELRVRVEKMRKGLIEKLKKRIKAKKQPAQPMAPAQPAKAGAMPTPVAKKSECSTGVNDAKQKSSMPPVSVPQKKSPGCFRARTWVRVMSGVRAIEEVRLGDRVATWLGGEWGYAASVATADTVFVRELHRVVRLRQERADGGWTEADLLRSVAWLAAHGVVKVGDRVGLELPEMGVSGAFQVMAVEPCPKIEPGPGRVVTGLFRHSRGRVYNLFVEGEPGPIGATSSHPVWSADRNAWVPARELKSSERVQVAGRTARVVRIEEAGDEPVFNLEIDADHCYRVGEQAILVHNASGPCKNVTVHGYHGAHFETTTLFLRPAFDQDTTPWQQIDPRTGGYLRPTPRQAATSRPGKWMAPTTQFSHTSKVEIILDGASKKAPGTSTDPSRAVRSLLFNNRWYTYGSQNAGGDPSGTTGVGFPAIRIGYSGHAAGMEEPAARTGVVTVGNDTAGHIIPHQFGGSNTDDNNFFAQSTASQLTYDRDFWGSMNHRASPIMARTIYDLLNPASAAGSASPASSCALCVEIEFNYPAVSLFPFTEDGARPYRPSEKKGVKIQVWEYAAPTYPIVARLSVDNPRP